MAAVPEPEYVTVIDEYTEIIELGYTDAFLEFVSMMDPEEARLMLCNETDTCDNLEIKKFSDILVWMDYTNYLNFYLFYKLNKINIQQCELSIFSYIKQIKKPILNFNFYIKIMKWISLTFYSYI